MSQTMSMLGDEQAAFAQDHRMSEDRDLRKLRRKNSFFSLRNLVGLFGGLRKVSSEWQIRFLMVCGVHFLVVVLAHSLCNQIGFGVPFGVFVALGCSVPLALIVAFMTAGVNTVMRDKRQTLAALHRSAAHLRPEACPVLTVEHVALREKLDALFAWGSHGWTKERCEVEADAVFAFMMEKFKNADEIIEIVESRGLFSVVEVRAVFDSGRNVAKPLREGAL